MPTLNEIRTFCAEFEFEPPEGSYEDDIKIGLGDDGISITVEFSEKLSEDLRHCVASAPSGTYSNLTENHHLAIMGNRDV